MTTTEDIRLHNIAGLPPAEDNGQHGTNLGQHMPEGLSHCSFNRLDLSDIVELFTNL